MEAHRIRRAYLEMLVENGHTIIPRTPLVLHDDPTTLFTGSGMQPLLRYLLGAPHPAGTRIGDVQPCLRAQDINDVGDNRHTTFFEMLGNWSFGDYAKSFQIPMLWRFLTDTVGLPPERIYVSCFIGDPQHGIARDDESAEIWTDLFRDAGISHERIDLDTEERGNEIGNQGARIAFYGAKNWWSRAGECRGHADRRPRRSRLGGVLLLPAGRARPGVRPLSPPELRRRPVPRNRQLGLHGVPAHRRRIRGSAPAQRRFRRRLGADRRGRHRQPRRLPHRSAVAHRGGAAVVVGPVLRGFDRRDARGHRPHPRSRAARRGRGPSGQQDPVLRHAQARAPGAALRARAGGHRRHRAGARPGDRRPLPRRLPGGRRRSGPHRGRAGQGGTQLRAHAAQGAGRDASPGPQRRGRGRLGVVRAPRHLRDARRGVRRGGAAHGHPAVADVAGGVRRVDGGAACAFPPGPGGGGPDHRLSRFASSCAIVHSHAHGADRGGRSERVRRG